MFATNLAGDFLPVQLVYGGKTKKCLPVVSFPESWHITYTHSHWCNEETTLDYTANCKIISPYIRRRKDELGSPESQPSLVIFDELTALITDAALSTLNNIFYVIVPPNCTDKL